MIELRCNFEDEGKPVVGRVVIDRLVDGSSSGGVRLREDVSTGELRVLASRMTLKYGFLGIPQGGAKAGLAFDPGAPSETRRRILRRFGREIGSFVLDRTFIPGLDMGTTPDDIRFIFEGAGREPSAIRFSEEGSGHHTGSSVFAGAAAALAEREQPLSGASAAIEGFGKVGTAAARLFFQNGAKVVAVSTRDGGLFHEGGLPVPEMIEAVKARGPAFVLDFPSAGRISREELLSLDVDILSPCAMVHSIHGGNAAAVRAGIVSSGANAPVTDEALAALHSRSVLVLPDFITNSGGVLGVFLEIAGFGVAEIDRLIPELIGPRVRELIRLCANRGVSPHAPAIRSVLARFERFKEAAEGRSGRSGLLRHSMVRAVRKALPLPVSKRLGLAYFRQQLGKPMFEET